MPLKYISILAPEVHLSNGWHQERRVSTLTISDKEPGLLHVLGMLPHGSLIRPETAADRDELVKFLRGLNYLR